MAGRRAAALEAAPGSRRTTSSRRCGEAFRKKTKVGHAGTLDPFATGLMLVLVGQGTRLQRYLVGLPKAYRAEVRFGVTSTTGDPTGELSATGGRAGEAAVRAALAQLTRGDRAARAGVLGGEGARACGCTAARARGRT